MPTLATQADYAYGKFENLRSVCVSNLLFSSTVSLQNDTSTAEQPQMEMTPFAPLLPQSSMISHAPTISPTRLLQPKKSQSQTKHTKSSSKKKDKKKSKKSGRSNRSKKKKKRKNEDSEDSETSEDSEESEESAERDFYTVVYLDK